MLFLVESVVICVLFTLMIVPATRKEEVSQIYNYPPAIIERVKTIPQYKDCMSFGWIGCTYYIKNF